MRKAPFLTFLVAIVILVFVLVLAVNYRPPSLPTSTPVVSSTTSPTNPTQNETRVTIKDNYFIPTNLTVQTGTTVKWINNGSDIHTTTSFASGSGGNIFLWNSGILQPGQTYSYTFNIAGTFDYYCGVHATIMFGQVVVNPTP